MSVNILGTEYEVVFGTDKEYPYLDGNDGYCDFTSKRIVIWEMNKGNGYEWDDIRTHRNRTLRHEIIHAFLFESGLDYSSNEQWARNEEMVDFFAIQIPKMAKVFMEKGL